MTRSLAEKLAAIESGTLMVGVDLGKEKHVAVVINQQAERLARFSFSNDRSGFDHFSQEIRRQQQKADAPRVWVGLEPTSYLWKPLAKYMTEESITYRLVNAYTVKRRREGDHLDRSKDDKRDAFVIADLLRTGKYMKSQLLTGSYAELRQYSSTYNRLQKEANQQKGLLNATVGQLFPELQRVFKDLTGITAQAMLKGHAAPAEVASLPVKEFIRQVQAEMPGRRLAVKKLRQAHALAGESVGMLETEALQQSIRFCVERLALLAEQVTLVKECLKETLLSLPEAPYILSLGLGMHTTAIIVGEIGDPSRYRRGDQLVKLAGTQPTPNVSGKKRNSKTPMSRKGRPRLRSALYFACLRLVKMDPGFKQLYQRLQTRRHNSLEKMEALGVLMNKVLRIIWALIQQEAFYDPERLLSA